MFRAQSDTYPRKLFMLLAALSIIAIIYLGSLFTSIVNQTNEEFEQFARHELKESEQLARLKSDIQSNHSDLTRLLINPDINEERIYEAGIRIIDQLRNIEKNAQQYMTQHFLSDEEKQNYEQLVEHIKQYREAVEWAVETTSVHVTDARRAIDRINAALLTTLTRISALDKIILDETIESFEKVQSVTETNLSLFMPIAGLVIFSLLLLAAYTYQLNQKFTASIKKQNMLLQQRVTEQTRELANTNKELMLSNEIKQHFLSRMSHELRTPLNAIIGFNEMNLLDEQNSETLKNNAEEIRKASNSLLKMIESMLDYQQSQVSQLDIKAHPIPVGLIVQQCIESIETEARDNNITIETDIDDMCLALADPYYLKVVIEHLLSNAIKYNRENGQVQVKTRSHDHGIQILVSDTGIGIESDNLQKIFEPFYKTDSQEKIIEGTGIGLSLCKSILDTMDASIEVESTPGEGSTFTITLQ